MILISISKIREAGNHLLREGRDHNNIIIISISNIMKSDHLLREGQGASHDGGREVSWLPDKN